MTFHKYRQPASYTLLQLRPIINNCLTTGRGLLPQVLVLTPQIRVITKNDVNITSLGLEFHCTVYPPHHDIQCVEKLSVQEQWTREPTVFPWPQSCTYTIAAMRIREATRPRLSSSSTSTLPQATRCNPRKDSNQPQHSLMFILLR